MPDARLTIGGDPSGALAAIAAVKAAIGGLSGKTVIVDVKVNQSGGGLDGLASSADRAADATDRAAESARGHANAADRAADSARDHANATARAGESARGAANWFQDVAKWMDSIGSTSDRANPALGQTARSLAGVGAGQAAIAGASNSMRALESSATGASQGVTALESGAAAAARPVAAIESGASGSSRALGSLGASAHDSSQYMVGAAGSAEQVSKALAPISRSADNAGQSMGGMGSAAGRAEQFMVGADGAAERVSKSMARMESVSMRSGPAMADGIGAFFGRMSQAEGFVGRLSNGIGALGDSAEAGLSGMSVGMRGVGMGALFATAGIGILTAATAGIGAAGVFGDIMKSGPMMNEARSAMHGFTQEFSAMSGATAAAGLGPMKGLSATVKELGGELAKVGVQNMGGILGGASTLVAATTGAISQLEPAIGPAVTATTALGKAVIGAFGNSGAAITSFANTVTAQSPGIQAGLEGVVQIAGQVGEVVVKAAGTLGPGINGDGATAAGGIGQFIRSISPKWVGQASDAVDRALGVTTDAQGNVTVGTSAPASSADAFGTSAGSTPHATGMKQDPGAPGGSRPFAPGEFSGSSFGWHMPAGAAPLVSGASNDMSGVVSDMSGSGGLGGGSTKQAPPAKAGAAYGAVTPGTAGPVATTAGSDAPGGAATPKPPPPPPPAAGAPVSGAPAAGIMPQGPGSAGPLPTTTAAVHALNMAMAQTPAAAGGAAAASAQMGATIGSSLGAAASKATSSTADVKTAMAGTQQAAAAPPPPAPPPPAAAAAAAAAAAPPPPPPKPPPAAPAAAAVAKTTAAVVSSAAPAAAAGGADIGASIGGGMGKGVTKEITNTLTIVKKWIVRVISTAAGALDAHSPSRVFADLGASIPQGLVVGMQAQAPAALSATQSMIKQVTAGAQAQLGSAQAPLAKAYAAALTPPQQPGQQQAPPQAAAAQRYPQMTPAAQQAQAEKKKQEQDSKDKAEQAEAARQSTFEANKKGLEERGLSPESAARKAGLEQKHNDRKKQIDERRRAAADAAVLRSRGETVADTGDPVKDAEANKAAAAGLTDKKQKHIDHQATARDNLKNWAQVHQNTQNQANQVGQSVPNGMAQGINQSSDGPADAASIMAAKAIEAAKKKTKTKSPSQEFHDIGKSTAEGMSNGMNAGPGLATGIGAGISAASSAIQGVASDSGLQVGYRYAQSMVSGINSVLKSDDFKAAAIPQIDSPQAKAALGDLGLLGPAGSGASIWKSSLVSMAAGAPATPSINLTLTLDGTPFRQLVLDQQDNLVSALLNQLKLQRT